MKRAITILSSLLVGSMLTVGGQAWWNRTPPGEYSLSELVVRHEAELERYETALATCQDQREARAGSMGQ